MESKEWLRRSCFGCLRFLGLDSTTDSLETWKSCISEYTRKITKQIECNLRDYSDLDLPRGIILAQLSALAILISREFDAALEAIVTGEWDSFDLLLKSERKQHVAKRWNWHDFRTKEVFLWCRLLARLTEQANEGENEPVREIEPWEKRLWCEEIARSLPRTTAPFEQEGNKHDYKQSWRRYKKSHRLHLSIEPFTPVEIVAEKVTEIVKRYQEEYLTEQVESLQYDRDKKKPYFTFDIIQKIIEEDRLNYDDIRHHEIGRRIMLKGKAKTFLKWLKIYHLKRRGYSPEEIAEYTNVPKDWKEHLQEKKLDSITREQNKEGKRAQKLIQAALHGKSLLTVSTKQTSPIRSQQSDH